MPNLLIISLINDTVAYITTPSNKGEIIFQLILIILGIIVTWLIAIFCKPVNKFILNARARWDMHRMNPVLDVEVSISGEMSPLSPGDFALRMRESLNNISNLVIDGRAGDTFRLSKNFNSFDANITISPSLNRTNDYDFLFIRVRTTNLRLKNLREGLGEIQLYLFRDLVGLINQRINFGVDNDNEGVSFVLEAAPKILLSIKGLNTDNITVNDDDIRVIFNDDNISFNGSIEPRTIEKIEGIVRSNLTA